MQNPFVEGSTLAEAKVVEEEQAFAVLGVGLVVVERAVLLAALEAAEEQEVVAGPVVPAALPAVYYQRGYMAQLAVAHPHHNHHPSSGGMLSSLGYSCPIRVWPGLLLSGQCGNVNSSNSTATA